MHIFILRHGEAGYKASSDRERELTDAGKQSSTIVADFCAGIHIDFSRIYSSPFRRARQTADIILTRFSALSIHESDSLLPESDPKEIISELSHLTNDSSVLLVTHEPFASTCIASLIHGSVSVHIAMKTSSLAYVETSGIVAPGAGRLVWLTTPSIMQRLMK